MSDEQALDAVRGWIDAATRVVVLTGAGISTDSGIPDFRGPKGVWTRNPAAEKQSTIQNYLADPAVRRAAPTADGLRAYGSNGQRAMAYVFAREADHVLARFFFPKHGSVIEDPGTGSACANLGGWLLATSAALPQRLTIDQGEAVGRPCRLGLEVTADRHILVSGRVIEIARGTVRL